MINKLLILFVGYLTVILLFAIWYKSIYDNQPECFLVRNQVESTHLRNKINTLESRLDDLQRYRRSGYEPNSYWDIFLETDLDSVDFFVAHDIEERSFDRNYTATFRIDSAYYFFKFYNPDKWIDYYLIIDDGAPRGTNSGGNFKYEVIEKGKKWFTINELEDRTIFKKIATLGHPQSEVEKNLFMQKGIEETKKELADLASNKNLWRYWDFAYFSVSTIFGGGYGDIVPNCSKVRRIVILEYLVCAFIILVLLNVLINQRSEK